MLGGKGKLKVDVLMPKTFVQLIDEVAELTGSTRSDFIRRAVERYIQELKQTNLLRDLREAEKALAEEACEDRSPMVKRVGRDAEGVQRMAEGVRVYEHY